MTGNWTAIIVNYNGAGFIEACLHALESCRHRPAEIIVVDNDSTDESLLELNGYPRANVLRQRRNLGFAGGANVGLAATETEIAVILNPDVEVTAGFGDAIVEALDANPRLAAAGPLLLYPDEQTIQHAGGRIERPLMTTSHYLYGAHLASTTLIQRDVDFVTGGAMVLRMAAVQEVGGFDELLSPVYYEDVDLCVRLRSSGWDVQFVPELRALHHEGVTLQREPIYYHFLHRNRIQFARKHLNDADWSGAFVPAEVARLRNELLHLESQDWLVVSGAQAIETLLRDPVSWAASCNLDAGPSSAFDHALDDARSLWEVTGPEKSGSGLGSRLIGGLVNRLGPKQYVDASLTDQRAFNASVVRALEAQRALNRDTLSTSLLLAVDVIGRLKQEVEPTRLATSPEN